jgi:hypothetical protein
MTTQAAYSSQHPAVMAAAAAMNAKQTAFSSELQALKEEFGADAFFSDVWGQRVFAGFGSAPEGTDVGWVEKRNGCFWPKQVGKPGRALAQRFIAIRYDHDPVPGMPKDVQDGMTRRIPGLLQHDGEVWVSWSCSHDRVEMNDTVDLEMWSRRRLVEYLVARAAYEATK